MLPVAEAMKTKLYYHFQHNIPSHMCFLMWRTFISLSTPLLNLLFTKRGAFFSFRQHEKINTPDREGHTPPKIIIHSRLYCGDSECTHTDVMRDGADGHRWVSPDLVTPTCVLTRAAFLNNARVIQRVKILFSRSVWIMTFITSAWISFKTVLFFTNSCENKVINTLQQFGHRGGRLVIASLKVGRQNKDKSFGENPQICVKTQLYFC